MTAAAQPGIHVTSLRDVREVAATLGAYDLLTLLAPAWLHDETLRALAPQRRLQLAFHDIVEITPRKDVNGITAITVGRFVCMMIGAAVRAGYFD